MKASIGKKIAVFCLSAAMAVGIGFGLSGIEAAQAHTSEMDIVLDTYKLDSVITVSDDATTGVVFPKTVQISDTEIASAYVITYPNGVSLSVKDGIVLDQVGLYTITYKSIVGGVANVYSDTFKVYNNFSSDGELVELYEKDVYSAYTKLAVKDSYGIYDPNTPTADATVVETVKGVRAKLAPGTTVSFNNVINVNNVRNDGFAELAFFNPNAVNRSEQALIYSAIDFTFTDVNDPNNYITVTLSCSVASVGFSFGASTGQLPLVGTRDTYVDTVTELAGSRRIFYVDGVKNVAYLNSTGTWGNGEQALYDYKILYNPETHVIMRECIRRFDFENGQKNGINTDVVVDLDNPDIYDEGAELFKGFSTGEVRLSVQARNFTDASGYCEFYGLGDIQYDDLRTYYTGDEIDDTKAPEIKINVKETDANGVYTVYDPQNPVKFKMPSAVAYDASECSDVSVRVYKNYSDASKIFVPANADGTFDVTEKVIYTLEYKATDAFGNVGYSTLRVVPLDTPELIEGDVQINGGIQAVFDKVELTTGKQYAGEILKYLHSYNITSDLKVKVSVTNGDEVMFSGLYNYADFEGENKPLFDVRPLTVGVYKVTYEISDNVGEVVYSYDVNCVSTGLVDFAEAPLLQRYYMLGMTYAKTDFTAYKFGNTVSENPTDMYVSYDDGATWTKVNKTFVMGANANGTLMSVNSVKFKYVSAGVEDLITDSAPVVDIRTDESIANNDPVRVKQLSKTEPGNLDQVKYFKGINAVVSKSTLNTVISTASVNSGNAITTFINPVSADSNGSFYFEFATDSTKADYNELIIRYVDAYDPTNVSEVKFFLANGATRISLNGSKDVDAGISLYGSTFQTYLSITNQVFSYSTQKFDFNFKPTNNIFYIELEMNQINGDNAQLTVTTIGNHKFQLARTVDSSSPMVSFNSAAGAYGIGTQVTIAAPFVNDILTPYVHTLADGTNRTKVTVMRNKQYVKSIDGVTLNGTQDPTRDYVIELNEFGTLDVKYDVSDEAGKSQSPSYSISAVDIEPPVIELNYGFNKDTIHNVTLGKAFSIEYNVTDNITDSTKLTTYVMIYRDSDYFNVYNSEPFEVLSDRSQWSNITDTCTLTRKGIYTVYIFAMDEDYNMTFASYKLNVQ